MSNPEFNIREYFPITDPVLIFSVVLFIILIAPIILKRYNIPNLIVLIIAGVIVGPNGLNILLRDQSMVLFGTVGLLYIMFIAGLEIDMNDFIRNKNKTLIHGFLTLVIPGIMAALVGYYILNLSFISSLLFASVLSSHTLLAYPIISRLGITNSRAVSIAVGGTIIADTGALLILAMIANYTKGALDYIFAIRMAISLSIFGFVIFYGFPKISRWFFKNFASEGVSQYIFILALVFLAGFLAHLAGIEPIIGAFLAGLALNRMIPHSSPLMNRIEFVGNALFIPFFLISVGMLVNLSVVFKGINAIAVSGVLIVVAISSKWIAAFITQKIFRFSSTERNLIFGLTTARAAATLASVLIGFLLGLLSEEILNGAIIMILITCLVSTLIVERAGRKQVMEEEVSIPELPIENPERILVPISNPESIEKLIDFAVMLKKPRSAEQIFPLIVIPDDDATHEHVIRSSKILDKAAKFAAASDNGVTGVTRVDMNIASGILRAIKELSITQVVIGWHARHTAKEWIFGSVLDNLLERSGKMVLVTNFVNPLNTTRHIVVVVPSFAEFESGFLHWTSTLITLAKQAGAELKFYASAATNNQFKKVFAESKTSVPTLYEEFNNWDQFKKFESIVETDDLLVVISARKASISHHSDLDNTPRLLSKHFSDKSFVVIYPEQNNLFNTDPAYSIQTLKYTD
ncbi:cation:proton antiporter [Daejeonella oryzae]|uniref:cation:proton antiporter n=1 Tax=Daejeonella oryzae TaxID=1122943 RepID=UPI0006846FA5|nr:cation:proton antiporter [Daejeonella oryzae]